MNTLTQTLKRRQAIVKYAKRYGVSKSSYRYNVSRPTIYKWMKRYDGHLGSLKDESRRPHHHANQHTEAELEQIRNMRRRNPNAGIKNQDVFFRMLLKIQGKPEYQPHHKESGCSARQNVLRSMDAKINTA